VHVVLSDTIHLSLGIVDQAISRALNLGGRIDSSGNIKLGGLDANKE
jgi:hypothetical protein